MLSLHSGCYFYCAHAVAMLCVCSVSLQVPISWWLRVLTSSSWLTSGAAGCCQQTALRLGESMLKLVAVRVPVEPRALGLCMPVVCDRWRARCRSWLLKVLFLFVPSRSLAVSLPLVIALENRDYQLSNPPLSDSRAFVFSQVVLTMHPLPALYFCSRSTGVLRPKGRHLELGLRGS